MKKSNVRVIYDRRNTVAKTGTGAVDIYIYLSRKEAKYVTFTTCTPLVWRKLQKSRELRQEIQLYEEVINLMIRKYEPMTIEKLNAHLGIAPKVKSVVPEKKKYASSKQGFIDFICDQMVKEKLGEGTKKRVKVILESLARYGRLMKMSDLTSINVKGYDDFLRMENNSRQDQSIYNYHKIVKKYARLAYQLDFIEKNPYEHPLCKFKRGEKAIRHPLSEAELKKVRDLTDLTTGELHARDLFIFSAYTGLAYADNQVFDFSTMTEEVNGTYYIDGERIKTGHSFFTPILPPAMEVLVKYNYTLPKMTNQKMNMYLHLIGTRAGLRKPLTSHVARHSFATMVLAHDVPIENVARMLGHTDTDTTRTYAKVLKSTIERHTKSQLASIL